MSARILLVVLSLAALIAFAPSRAAAHAGHAQHQVTKVMQIDAPAAASAAARYNVQVAATLSADTDHAGHSHDDGRGCCPNGHCGSFCFVLAPAATPAVLTVTQIEPLRSRDAASPPGTAVDGPARPPQSFA